MAYLLFSIILGVVFAGMVYSRWEKNSLLAVVAGVICSLFWVLVNYLVLPTLGWEYIGVYLEVLITLLVAALVRSVIAEPEWHLVYWIPIAVTGVLAILMLSSSEMFNSRRYQSMIDVQEVEYDNMGWVIKND